LSKAERASLAAAEVAAAPTPVPVQIVSSDEYVPPRRTRRPREVEARLNALADEIAPRHGLDRRSFFRTASGMAAAFLAMNEVYGALFDASRAEAAEPEAAQARANRLAGQYVVDVHTDFLRDD